MFLKIFLALACAISPIAAQDLDFYYVEPSQPTEEAAPLFISLGRTCHVAIGLRAINLRDASYPFDWIITSNLDTLIHALDDKLAHYTDPEHFTPSCGHPHSVNTFYGLQFIHDFTNDPAQLTEEKAAEEWASFKERYDRRVERFKNLDQYPGKVFFLRTHWDFEHEGANGEFFENTIRARRLRDALRGLFPNLNFNLVILTRPELSIPPIENLEDVVEIRLPHAHGQPLYDKLMELAYGKEELTSQATAIDPISEPQTAVLEPEINPAPQIDQVKHENKKNSKKSKKSYHSKKKRRKSR